MSVINITKDNFNTEVMHSDRPVLIDFWATWCGPCKMLSPTVEEIAEETSAVKVCKVNIDEQPELANQFQIMSIPTLVMVNNGIIVNRSVGVKPKSSITGMLKV